jgi:ABC-type dipeptide/oligopeptide/nickel transport system permease subunit
MNASGFSVNDGRHAGNVPAGAVVVAPTRKAETKDVKLPPRAARLPHRLGLGPTVGLVLVILVVLVAIFAPLLAPYAYDQVSLGETLKPPMWVAGGSPSHPLGTDQLGRDLLSRVIYGARTSLSIGIGAVLLAGVIGILAGIGAGYAGGRTDELVGRLAEVQLAFPPIFLAIAIMAVIGQSLLNVVLVLGFVSWVQYQRVARANTLAVKHHAYVEAARAVGATPGRVLLRHILPNVLPALVAIATVSVSTMIIAEAGLSFLGLGIQPPLPAWGGMLADSRDVWEVAPWTPFFPGAAILITVLAINLLGAGLTDDQV